jgi:hypothetical protein
MLTEDDDDDDDDDYDDHNRILRLVHPSELVSESSSLKTTLRLAEDLRFFHAHLAANGILRRCDQQLVVYRHVVVVVGGQQSSLSQSSLTSRKLLLQLRTRAFELAVLRRDPLWKNRQFIVWGAGRDGKDFVKALSSKVQSRVYCMMDVDDTKIQSGFYVNPPLIRIPIVHFSFAICDQEQREQLTRSWQEGLDDAHFGRIVKNKMAAGTGGKAPPAKKRRLACNHAVDLSLLPELPVVVCVAMYRTNGALESNVKLIGRTEGKDLWHFS